MDYAANWGILAVISGREQHEAFRFIRYSWSTQKMDISMVLLASEGGSEIIEVKRSSVANVPTHRRRVINGKRLHVH